MEFFYNNCFHLVIPLSVPFLGLFLLTIFLTMDFISLFFCMPDNFLMDARLVNLTLLDTKFLCFFFFCIPLNIFEFCTGVCLSYVEIVCGLPWSFVRWIQNRFQSMAKLDPLLTQYSSEDPHMPHMFWGLHSIARAAITK